MTEREFTRTVLELAKRLGWMSAHFRTAQTSRGAWVTPVAGDGKGFPDLILVRDDRLVAAELKMPRRYPSSEQRAWLHALEGVGAEMYVWRPADLDEIAAVLR